MLCADMVEGLCWERTARTQMQIHRFVGRHLKIGDVFTVRNAACRGLARRCKYTALATSFPAQCATAFYREIGYFVGIELEASSKWSRQQFEPQHLHWIWKSWSRAASSGAA